ncbi:hypothetical protein FOG48_00706 [Hanseniaspora uvarum]|nr:hypothetical protein FOG48_00706 [Hanseniaspora uvarum]GMM39236.1 hypothetical protein DAHU10_001370 [Hanseniaspora uvarum]
MSSPLLDSKDKLIIKNKITFNGKHIIYLHTVLALFAFITAGFLAIELHYYKVIKNAFHSYPNEWFPSVSASIGDHFPERNIFQIVIVLCSFPRFLIHLMQFSRGFPSLSIIGFLRTVCCGIFVYITSSDNHDVHDVGMIGYIVLTIPYYILNYKANKTSLKLKKIMHVMFFVTLVPLIYWYIQHSIKRRAGAYSIYAYFEWSLIIQDVLNDHLYAHDYKDIGLGIVAS